ncbi:hypothetical protein KCP74_13035 [Salmonella enterica subsp. enterica]|nr:hypothetical protein KCP74_13035 [Salmonella enterica subsp. enterica]
MWRRFNGAVGLADGVILTRQCFVVAGCADGLPFALPTAVALTLPVLSERLLRSASRSGDIKVTYTARWYCVAMALPVFHCGAHRPAGTGRAGPNMKKRHNAGPPGRKAAKSCCLESPARLPAWRLSLPV